MHLAISLEKSLLWAWISNKSKKGRYKDMTVKLLKPYKGFEIEKSYEEKADGTIKKDTIVYTAYADDEDNALFDAARTLSELKKKIDIYLR